MTGLRFIVALLFFSLSSRAYSDASFPEFRTSPLIWRSGVANFYGQVIAPACSLVMDDSYQSIDMGDTPIMDLQNTSFGPEKKIVLTLRNCELSKENRKAFTGVDVRLTFDGVRGSTPDVFHLSDQARGVDLQIIDANGYSSFSGKPMRSKLLYGSEQKFIYSLRLTRNDATLNVGDYNAILRFKVDYE